jgi:Flp pilus assembly protein TadG
MQSSQTGRSRLERGQNAVEFALLLPVLFLILFGILDLGRLFFAAITITNAARDGARYGIEHPNDTAGIQARVEAEAAGTGIDLSDSTLTTITRVCPSGCASQTPIRIEVTYTLHLIVPGIFGVDELPVRSYAEMMVL